MTINTKNLRPIESTDLIRMGRPNDGGYVIPEKIFSFCDGLLSYGINKDWSFEKDFWKKKSKYNNSLLRPFSKFFDINFLYN